MVKSGIEIFFAPKANTIPIDFPIRMKCGLVTERKSFIELLFEFLLNITTKSFALLLVICRYGLKELQFVGLATRQAVIEKIKVSRLALLEGFLELLKSVWRTCSTLPSDVAGRPDSFALHRQPSFLNFFCELHIRFAFGDFLKKFLKNTRCTIRVCSGQGCGSGYFSTASDSASTPIASASTNKKRENDR